MWAGQREWGGRERAGAEDLQVGGEGGGRE